jgi:hypothetical protein
VRESDLPNENPHGTFRRLMRVGVFLVLLVRDPKQPMSTLRMLPNAGVFRRASHIAATPRQNSSAARRVLLIPTTIQLLRAVDERSDSILHHGTGPGNN